MGEKDLLQAIKIPFDDPTTVYFDYGGPGGFPAMGLRPGSDIKSPYRLYLPERFYAEFSVTATVKLSPREGGFLFAVVNPLDTVSDHQNVIYKTNASGIVLEDTKRHTRNMITTTGS